MKQRFIRACTFLAVSVLTLSPQLFSNFQLEGTSSVATAASIDKQSEAGRQRLEVVARVKIEYEHHRDLLTRPGVSVLDSPKGKGAYVLTTDDTAEQLRREGWEVEILFSRADHKEAKWKYVGSAPQGDCFYTADPLNRALTASGGTGFFDLDTPADCEWVVITPQTWIFVNGVRQGAGPTRISFSVEASTEQQRRIGVIFVGTAAFEVLQGAQFLDVIPSHPFYSEIGIISARGITLGCGEGNFCPQSPVTREQMAAFLVRAKGEFNPPTPAMQRFADVPPSNPFYNFIDRLAELSITFGCGGGNYCPSNLVLREQMAAFLLRARGEFSPPTPILQRFIDVPPTNPFYNFIDRLAELQITQGCSTNMFCPLDNVDRGQMAAFIFRTFEF
jgi:hypothetical protein